jgi:hypothetical protein
LLSGASMPHWRQVVPFNLMVSPSTAVWAAALTLDSSTRMAARRDRHSGLFVGIQQDRVRRSSAADIQPPVPSRIVYRTSAPCAPNVPLDSQGTQQGPSFPERVARPQPLSRAHSRLELHAPAGSQRTSPFDIGRRRFCGIDQLPDLRKLAACPWGSKPPCRTSSSRRMRPVRPRNTQRKALAASDLLPSRATRSILRPARSTSPKQ